MPSQITKINNTESSLLGLLSIYKNRREPIEVDFRNLVKWLPYGERATHFIHPYPGKLLYHIPHFFLSNQVLCKNNGIVFDPFCGSGTVLLESVLNNKNAIGIDINPLAVLISKVKTTPIDIVKLKEESSALRSKIPDEPESKAFNDVVNIDYWFYPHVKNKLQRVFDGINKIENEFIKSFFLISLSNSLRHVSLANPRMSVPVKLKANKYQIENPVRDVVEKRLKRLKRINVLKVFFEVVEANIKRLENFVQLYNFESEAKVHFADCQNGYFNKEFDNNGSIKENSIDIVITSPPYVSAQKYIRASSLSLGWLKLCNSDQLKYFENICIGREHYPVSEYKTIVPTGIPAADELILKIYQQNPLRAHISTNYLIEMKNSINNIYKSLKPKAHIILIIAENRVCNYKFNTPEYINTILKEMNFNKRLELVDNIKSRALLTKRNGTSGVIFREHVCVYQKEV